MPAMCVAPWCHLEAKVLWRCLLHVNPNKAGWGLCLVFPLFSVFSTNWRLASTQVVYPETVFKLIPTFKNIQEIGTIPFLVG